jgi:1-acyl-sn-glycerol-3-phosphate acyltransferase
MAASAIIYSSAAVLTGLFSRRLALRVARLWCRHLLLATGVRLTVQGLANIERGKSYVFVANHQSHYDIPVLFAGIGSTISFIAKKELFRIPVFGWGMKSIGCISLDRKSPRKARTAMTRAVEILRKDNLSLVLFPEGTRSETGDVGEFKRGSFTLAIEAGVPVVPVAIQGTGEIHRKGSSRVYPGEVTVIVGTPLSTEAIQNLSKEELSGAIRGSIVAALNDIQP